MNVLYTQYESTFPDNEMQVQWMDSSYHTD